MSVLYYVTNIVILISTCSQTILKITRPALLANQKKTLNTFAIIVFTADTNQRIELFMTFDVSIILT